MNMTVLVAIISVGAAIITTILTGGFKILELWYQNRLKNKAKKNRTPLKDVAKFSLDLDQVLFDIMRKTGADRVFFARFHNGGTFIDGIPMDKFTVTNEVYSFGQSKISPLLQNVLLSTRSSIMYELLFEYEFKREDTSKYTDGFEKMVLDQNIKSIYMFLISDLNDMPIGFIEVSFINKIKTLDLCEIMFIKDQHNEILKLSTYKDDLEQ